MSKLKVLLIENSRYMTGALKSILGIATNVTSHIQYYFVAPSINIIEIINSKGFSASYIPFVEIQKSWKLLSYFPSLFVNTYRLNKKIQKEKISIVHVNDFYNMSGVLLKLIHPSIKLIYHIRLLPESYLKPIYNLLIRIILKYSDHIICVSHKVKNSIPNSNKSIVIYDSIEPSIDNKTQTDLFDRFTFLYVGNIINGKGQNYAIEAFNRAKPYIQGAQLVFIGRESDTQSKSAYKQVLENKVIQYKLFNDVLFLGYKENINDYYCSADVTLNFSESESFSMVCLESLLAETPVISSKSGGPEEIIQEGVNGLLVKNKDVNEMANAMVTIFNQNELRLAMVRNTKTSIKKFSIEDSSNLIKSVYNQ